MSSPACERASGAPFLSTLNYYPSARQSFLEVVQYVTGPESCITPAATPGYAVDDQPAVVGSLEATNRTGSTVLEIGNRTYNETTSITDTLDPNVVLSCEVQGPHQDAQNPRT